MIAPGGFTGHPPYQCPLEFGDVFAADCEFETALEIPRIGDRVRLRPLSVSAVLDRPVIAEVRNRYVIHDRRDANGDITALLVRLECSFITVSPV